MTDLMNYKGYRATARFSAEDSCFIGQIIGIEDVIGFEGSTVEELQKMFRESVDSYLEWCKARGKKPGKEYKGTFNIRISPEKHSAAVKRAAELGISLNQFVAEAIEDKLNEGHCIYPTAEPEKIMASETVCEYDSPCDSELEILNKAIEIITKYKK